MTFHVFSMQEVRKGVWPPPTYLSVFADGGTSRMTFWCPAPGVRGMKARAYQDSIDRARETASRLAKRRGTSLVYGAIELSGGGIVPDTPFDPIDIPANLPRQRPRFDHLLPPKLDDDGVMIYRHQFGPVTVDEAAFDDTWRAPAGEVVPFRTPPVHYPQWNDRFPEQAEGSDTVIDDALPPLADGEVRAVATGAMADWLQDACPGHLRVATADGKPVYAVTFPIEQGEVAALPVPIDRPEPALPSNIAYLPAREVELAPEPPLAIAHVIALPARPAPAAPARAPAPLIHLAGERVGTLPQAIAYGDLKAWFGGWWEA